MKLIFIVWALLAFFCGNFEATVAIAQIQGMEAGSAEANAALQRYFAQRDADIRATELAKKNGESLFGLHKRWEEFVNGKGDFGGTLSRKAAADFQVGDWGFTSNVFVVIQKTSDETILVRPLRKDSEPMLLRGLDLKKVTDGAEFVLHHPIAIVGTETYTTVAGSTKTVLMIDASINIVEEFKARDEKDGYRSWIDAEDKLLVFGKLVDSKLGKAQLQPKVGAAIDVQLTKLSVGDRRFVREEMQRRREADRAK